MGLSSVFLTVRIVLVRIYQVAENRYQRSPDCWRLQKSYGKDLRDTSVHDHLWNSNSLVFIWQECPSSTTPEATWGYWEGEQEGDPQVQAIHLPRSIWQYQRRCGRADAWCSLRALIIYRLNQLIILCYQHSIYMLWWDADAESPWLKEEVASELTSNSYPPFEYVPFNIYSAIHIHI